MFRACRIKRALALCALEERLWVNEFEEPHRSGEAYQYASSLKLSQLIEAFLDQLMLTVEEVVLTV